MITDPERTTIPPNGKLESEQPRWRRDFPIDVQQDDYVSRRDFTGFMVLTSLAFVVGQFWIVIQNFLLKKRGKPPIMKIAEISDIPIGGTIIFKYPDTHSPKILVRLDKSLYVSYDQQCTHLTCPVVANIETGKFHCPCHEGSFDLKTGQPLAGPPRRALQKVILDIRDTSIYATGIEERLA